MSREQFAITRTDGRSNQQVIIDLVRDREPGTLFTYGELVGALNAGSGREYNARLAQSTVRQAQRRLLAESQRTMKCVPGIGYRLAQANEHATMALQRRQRAHVQQRFGLALLQNVRWDELDPNARKAHEGTLMITQAIYQQQCALEQRQSAVEAALKTLTAKVDELVTTG